MTTLEEEAKSLKDKVEKEGLDNVSRYINEKLEQWRNEPVKFAVTGASRTGKSRFINSIRNLKPGDIGFAKSSALGDTTLKPTKYHFPGNPLINIFDLPGFGTMQQTLGEYEKRMNLHNYDFFFIFIEHIQENDVKIAQKLKELKKPFCFVRSKLDQDLANCEYDTQSKSKLIYDIKSTTFNTLKKANLTDATLFVISSQKQNIGEFYQLVAHFEDRLSNLKREVLIYSLLGILSKDMIERKYQELQKRVFSRSVGSAGVASLPIPGLDVMVNIGIIALEIEHYKEVFGFNQQFVKETAGLDGVRERVHKNSLIMITNDSEAVMAFVMLELGKFASLMALQSAVDPLIPVFGNILSACTAGIVTYRFLNRLLDRCKDDAKVVYSYLMDNPLVENAAGGIT